jgi:hypothetical protein
LVKQCWLATRMMRMNTETFSEAPTHRGTRLIAAIAFLPIFTAVLYLNGWAYHEGYLDYFHLPSSMFPLDLQATLVHGVMAWLDGGTKALIWMGQSVADQTVESIFLGVPQDETLTGLCGQVALASLDEEADFRADARRFGGLSGLIHTLRHIERDARRPVDSSRAISKCWARHRY